MFSYSDLDLCYSNMVKPKDLVSGTEDVQEVPQSQNATHKRHQEEKQTTTQATNQRSKKKKKKKKKKKTAPSSPLR